jgi:hypothetical protein
MVRSAHGIRRLWARVRTGRAYPGEARPVSPCSSKPSANPAAVSFGWCRRSYQTKSATAQSDKGDIQERARIWRTNRIVRFAEDQRRKREWINFAEIADWCSEVDGSVVPNESARASAYEKLQRDLLEGDFEENGRSRVLYLHPWTVKAKVTRQWMENMIETHPPATIRSKYLDHCWLPRNLFQRWLAKHHLPASAPRPARELWAIHDLLQSLRSLAAGWHLGPDHGSAGRRPRWRGADD